jgi:hypothetical protein
MTDQHKQLLAKLWKLGAANPDSFTDEEKELYMSEQWKIVNLRKPNARRIFAILNSHPEVACSFVCYPSSVHLRLKKPEVFKEKILHKCAKDHVIHDYSSRLVLNSRCFVVYFYISPEPTIHKFCEMVKEDISMCNYESGVDRVIDFLAGEKISSFA